MPTVAKNKGNRLIVGFAAETERVAENARKKLTAKNADIIVANDVTAEGAGFDVDTNIVTLFSRDGRDLPLPRMSKTEVAQRILDEVVRLRSVLHSAGAHRALTMADRISEDSPTKTLRTRLSFYEDIGINLFYRDALSPRVATSGFAGSGRAPTSAPISNETESPRLRIRSARYFETSRLGRGIIR